MELTKAPKVPGIANAFTPTNMKAKTNTSIKTSPTKIKVNLVLVIPIFSRANYTL